MFRSARNALAAVGLVIPWLVAGCGGGGASSTAPITPSSPTPSTAPSTTPDGPVSIAYQIAGNTTLFPSPLNFFGSGQLLAVTVVVSEPGDLGPFALTLSRSCPGGALVLPNTTNAIGQAAVYVSAAQLNPIPATAGCTIGATDAYGNVASAQLLVTYATGEGGIAARRHL